MGLPDELLKLTREADFVVNCAPLTPQTKGVFNQEFFAAMKPGAYFLNVGRGGSVITADLIAALHRGQDRRAGLDVVDPEPLPAASPLWHLPNVIITPHNSANTALTDSQRVMLLRENLRRYVAGDPMLAVVDLDGGIERRTQRNLGGFGAFVAPLPSGNTRLVQSACLRGKQFVMRTRHVHRQPG